MSKLTKTLHTGTQYVRQVFSTFASPPKDRADNHRVSGRVSSVTSKSGQVPYLQHYAGYVPDDLLLFNEFALGPETAQPGFITDFLGVRTRTASLFDAAKSLDGQILGLPIPSDYHAEAIEWLGLLKSVRAAKHEYVAMELGAGWGPWLVSGGAAARQRGIRDIRLCGVEGDQDHYQSLCQHFRDNGFDPNEHSVLLAAVGTKNGVAQWPVVRDPGNEWGLRPTGLDNNHAADKDLAVLLGNRITAEIDVKVIALGDLLAKERRWDLVHVDIQGGEAQVLGAFRHELNERVHYLVVGTHSRKIEGDLMEMFHSEGWRLEHEKPCRMIYKPKVSDLVSMTLVDGTQVWRNPRQS